MTEMQINADALDYALAKIRQMEDENRQLKRALWLARADRAFAEMEKYETEAMMWKGRDDKIHKWHNVYRKCRAMADKYAPITTYHNLSQPSRE